MHIWRRGVAKLRHENRTLCYEEWLGEIWRRKIQSNFYFQHVDYSLFNRAANEKPPAELSSRQFAIWSYLNLSRITALLNSCSCSASTMQFKNSGSHQKIFQLLCDKRGVTAIIRQWSLKDT